MSAPRRLVKVSTAMMLEVPSLQLAKAQVSPLLLFPSPSLFRQLFCWQHAQRIQTERFLFHLAAFWTRRRLHHRLSTDRRSRLAGDPCQSLVLSRSRLAHTGRVARPPQASESVVALGDLLKPCKEPRLAVSPRSACSSLLKRAPPVRQQQQRRQVLSEPQPAARLTQDKARRALAHARTTPTTPCRASSRRTSTGATWSTTSSGARRRAST